MGFDLDAILHHTSHMNTHSRCFTTLCIMSQHVHFHFVNGDNNSEQPLHSHPTLLTCPMMNKQYIMQIDVICESSCNMVTCQFEFSKCCVWFQCFTQWCCSCVSNLVTCWYERKREWVDCRWRSFESFFVITTQIECSECCVWFQCFTQWCRTCVSNQVHCLCVKKRKVWIVDGCLWCVFFLLSSPLRSSSMSVVFVFNASLSDVAPVSPILLPVN